MFLETIPYVCGVGNYGPTVTVFWSLRPDFALNRSYWGQATADSGVCRCLTQAANWCLGRHRRVAAKCLAKRLRHQVLGMSGPAQMPHNLQIS